VPPQLSAGGRRRPPAPATNRSRPARELTGQRSPATRRRLGGYVRGSRLCSAGAGRAPVSSLSRASSACSCRRWRRRRC